MVPAGDPPPLQEGAWFVPLAVLPPHCYAPSLWEENITLGPFATEQALNNLCLQLILTSAFICPHLRIAGTVPFPEQSVTCPLWQGRGLPPWGDISAGTDQLSSCHLTGNGQIPWRWWVGLSIHLHPSFVCLHHMPRAERAHMSSPWPTQTHTKAAAEHPWDGGEEAQARGSKSSETTDNIFEKS